MTGRLRCSPLDHTSLARLWDLYAGMLRHHHQGEDDVIFPLVAGRVPDFGDVEAEMHAEHHGIDELLAVAGAAFERLQSDAAPEHARQAHEAVGALEEALATHLAHEETAALPVIASVIGEDEMVGIEKIVLETIPRRERGMSLAALDAAAREQPHLHLPPVPKPVLLLRALVWRRRYAAMVAQAGA